MVAPSGAKSWQYRYKLDGKGQTATLGKYPSMSLAEARSGAMTAREKARSGEHLTVAKRIAKVQRSAGRTATFEKLAADWVEIAFHLPQRWSCERGRNCSYWQCIEADR